MSRILVRQANNLRFLTQPHLRPNKTNPSIISKRTGLGGGEQMDETPFRHWGGIVKYINGTTRVGRANTTTLVYILLITGAVLEVKNIKKNKQQEKYNRWRTKGVYQFFKSEEDAQKK